MKEIILVGGGGHCKVCIEIIERSGNFKIAGIVDKKERIGEKVLNYPIIASDDDINDLLKDYSYFLITVGQIKSADKRRSLFERIKSLGGEFPVVISPLSKVSPYCDIGEGTVVMDNVIINPDAKIGKNCIINTGSIIEHDCEIGDHCHISTGAVINGGVRIGDGTFVGSNSTVSNGVTITDNVVIGAGSVVIKDIKDSGVYAGNPLRKIG
ncbi:MAG TPA: acetyltransferase [Persephonella sp.]|uniref:Transferase hexapeptide repeat protein n=1 Tax=Persephonella marina (strain DSM 14350 / EX-H1) TaxID=123214 RepID=C0QRU8_PERMH|nr:MULTISPECIES: acetyltransferase [Persephonella]ACO04157.1 transferase hexapeptide repeat protein [Persephonella marina EX-H1]HCB69139.1 acetyltransferase [Persephonella sp.]